jgi:hypothetical protein
MVNLQVPDFASNCMWTVSVFCVVTFHFHLKRSTNGAVGPMFFGGPRAVYFSDKPKIFSDKPKIFPDDNILNLHPPPPSTTLTNSDNIDNFPTTLTIFRRVSTIGGPWSPLATPATAPLRSTIYTNGGKCNSCKQLANSTVVSGLGNHINLLYYM